MAATASRLVAALALISTAAASWACQPPGSAKPVTIWPARAARGELVAMPIDSNAVPGDSAPELYGLSRHNVSILIDYQTGTAIVTKAQGLRVVESWSAPGVPVFNWEPRSGRTWMAIAVFKVPTSIPSTLPFPVTATVRPLVNGQPIDIYGDGTFLEANLELVAGPPKVTDVIPLPQDLEPPPLLRLVAVAAPDRFDPDWFSVEGLSLGSIELEIDHPSLVPVDAFAANGTAAIGPGSGPTRTRVILVHPKGFQLAQSFTGQAGDGPVLDVAFPSTARFLASEFTLRNLRVTDVDGNPLIDAALADDYFTAYARAQAP
jgi:hypothetical protein